MKDRAEDEKVELGGMHPIGAKYALIPNNIKEAKNSLANPIGQSVLHKSRQRKDFVVRGIYSSGELMDLFEKSFRI